MALEPGHPAALTRQAAGQLLEGQSFEALAACDSAVEAEPDNLQARVMRGLARKEAGLLDDALEDFGRVLELSPGHFAGLLGRGMVYLDSERYEEALEDFDELQRRYPHVATVYLFRSFVHEAREERFDALEDREKATELNPALADLFLGDLQADVKGDRPMRMTPQLMKALLTDLLPRSDGRPPEP